jgi:hypothetical protein
MYNYYLRLVSIVFGIRIRWFVRLCEIFTSWRLQPQLAFEVMSHVHYKMAGHKWRLSLYEKTTAWWMHSELGVTCSLQDGWPQIVSEIIWKDNCMMTAFRTWFWGFIKYSAHFDCVHNWFVRLCRIFSAWWLQSQLVLTLCQMFAVRWLQMRLVCEVMSNGHCMITAVADDLYRIGWSRDNAAELHSVGSQIEPRPEHRYRHWGFSRLGSVHPAKFRNSTSIRPRPFGGIENIEGLIK